MASEGGMKETMIGIKEYVQQRATQVSHLLQMVDNSKLVSGEVTKGPRTAAQRLPRHMRRRAMAYDIRRFPKGLREFAAPFLAASHRKKPPSRFARRRSTNLLLNYIRRQRRNVWLETHIWHAKRFHTVEKWGYRMPDRSFQRSFRPSYRDSIRHCSIRDKSYLSCFQLSSSSQTQLISLLSPLFNQAASPTPAFKSSLSGRFEVSTLIYKSNQYPHQLIGPARFMWAQQDELYYLMLWVHPSSREDVRKELIDLLKLSKIEEEPMEEDEKSDSSPSKLEEWRLMKMKIRTDVYNGLHDIKLFDLRDQLVRFRLYGPKSMAIIADTMKLVEDDENDQYTINLEEWRENFSKLAAGEMMDGTVFSLLVKDPRIFRISNKKKLPTQSEDDNGQIGQNDVIPAIPCCSFWDFDSRRKALENRLTDSELNKMKGECIGKVEETNAKIPVIIIVRNGGSGRGETLCGAEIILPCGFGMDFWIAFQMRTARATGLRDELAAHLEAGRMAFPGDIVDSDAGEKEIDDMKKQLQEKYDRRPYNRRVLYWKKMSIKYPFEFHFEELIREWNIAKKVASVDSKPYVLRNRRLLYSIKQWMEKKDSEPGNLLIDHPNALISVEILCIARGKPRRYGLVCLPTIEDLRKLNSRYKDGACIIEQTPRGLEMNGTDKPQEVTPIEEDHGSPAAKKKKNNDDMKDIVQLVSGPSDLEKPISLKALFPNAEVLDKNQKRTLNNRKKKIKAKLRKILRPTRLAEMNAEEEEIQKSSYRDAANRLTIGRIVRGDFSFFASSGRAMALIPLSTLIDVRQCNGIVLLRNSTSKYYHPARLSICQNILEI